MLIAVVLYYLLSLIKNFNISRFWDRYFGAVVYLSALMFALLHLPAYRFEGVFIEKILAMILISIPYIIMGMSLGYIRVRFGFLYAVFFHAVWNLCSAAAIFYRMSL
ncbi:CPBP family glutamic-type intramembrane protease [Geofilum rubicundum]